MVCSGQPNYTTDSTPTLGAKAIGHDVSNTTDHTDDLNLNFTYYNANNNSRTGTVEAPSNTEGYLNTGSSAASNSSPLSDGAYHFNVTASTIDHGLTSSPSATATFTIDTTPPTTPIISSFSYPPNTWGNPNGGTFHINGDTTTAGFAYTLDSAGVETKPNTSDCTYTSTANRWVPADSSGNGAITIPSSLSTGYHVLYVKAFDHAHNMSTSEAAYTFYASPALTQSSTLFEGESSTFTASSVSGACTSPNTCQSYIDGPSAVWSQNQQLRMVSTATGARWSTSFSAGVAATYAINIQLTYCGHCAIVQVTIDGAPLNTVTNQSPSTTNPAAAQSYIDTCASGVTAQPTNVPLAGLYLSQGQHTLSITTFGTTCPSATYNGTYGTNNVSFNNVNDNGYTTELDYYRVIPINDATYGSINAAMNNNGITQDGGTAGDLLSTTRQRSLSQTALTNTGYGPGQTVTVDTGTAYQASFTMPQYNSDTATATSGLQPSADNIIAMGQTIILNAAPANYLDLLTTSTCQATDPNNNDATIQITENYANGHIQHVEVPDTPEAFSNATPTSGTTAYITKVVTLTYTRQGTATSIATASLYHISIPLDTTTTGLQSITLPYMRPDLSGACNTANFHVFAVATH